MTFLVSGASGFLGAHLCEALVRQGSPVRGMVRSPNVELSAGVEPVFVSGLTDRDGVRLALQGADRVIHLAARVHITRNTASDPAAEFQRVNVEGTRLLLEESIRAGVRTFVFFSSVKAMTEGSDEILTETTPPQPTDPYGCSKLEAERVVSELAEAAGISAPILRLPLVYGPRMRANVLELFRMIDRGIPLPLGSVRNYRSLVYTGNVVAAVKGILSAAPRGAEVFLVSDSERVSTPELVRHIGAALGRRVRILPVPVALLRAAGRIGDLGAALAHMPMISPRLDRLLESLAVDSSKLVRAVPQWPPYTLNEGLQSTARWFRASASERVIRA